MARIDFSEFMAVYNMMKNDRDEWMRAAAALQHQQQHQQQQSHQSPVAGSGATAGAAAIVTSTTSSPFSPTQHLLRLPEPEGPDENIEIHADLLFKRRAGGAGEDDEMFGEENLPLPRLKINLSASSSHLMHPSTPSSHHHSPRPGSGSGLLLQSLKSYPADRTSDMRSRARAELEAQPRCLSSNWLIKQRSLKAGIAGLRFFADDDLNSLLIQVLERKDCLDSPTRAVRAVARIFWSDEELASKHLRRPYSRSSSGPKDDPGDLPHSADVHDLFMILHGMEDVAEWMASGRHQWLYGALHAFKSIIKKEHESANPQVQVLTDDPINQKAKRRFMRQDSASSCDNNNNSSTGHQELQQPSTTSTEDSYVERKRMRSDDGCGSSSDGIDA